MMIREIVRIDEDTCNGCGLCVPACHEGAVRIESGKARLASDRLCDGLGACLGVCPQDAITIERREAEAFDETLVAMRQSRRGPGPTCPPPGSQPDPAGCPGSKLGQFKPLATPTTHAPNAAEDMPPELTHWPVQLHLLPPQAPVLRGARLLVAADCVPVACADFQAKLLRGRTVVIGCPKFDDLAGYIERLAAILQVNKLQEIVVARMEVPCCAGIVAAVLEARRRSGVGTKITEVVVSIRGEIKQQRELPVEAVA